MNGSDPITAIMRGKQYWFGTCDRFLDFVERYQKKIQSKVRNAKDAEYLEDVSFELEVVCLFLLDDRFEVEYEKYSSKPGRNPDYTITFEKNTVFNVEVGRIREADQGYRFDKWVNEVVERGRAVHSDLAFRLKMPKLDAQPDLVDRLEASKEKIAQYIQLTIQNQNEKLPLDTPYEYIVPGFENELMLVLSRPSGKPTKDRTLSYGVSPRAVFYKKNEFHKFGDAISGKLGQMRPGMINVLILSSGSTTHEDVDLNWATESIKQLIDENNDAFFVEKGFQDTQDFVHQFKNLGGVLFRSTWVGEKPPRNLLWCNDLADQPIPELIAEYMRNMDRPK